MLDHTPIYVLATLMMAVTMASATNFNGGEMGIDYIDQYDVAQNHISDLAPLPSKRAEPKSRYCGYQLYNAILIACARRSSRNKREALPIKSPMFMSIYRPSMDDSESNEHWDEDSLGLIEQQPVLGRFMASHLVRRLKKRQVQTRQASDECCSKSCSQAELRQFCHILGSRHA